MRASRTGSRAERLWSRFKRGLKTFFNTLRPSNSSIFEDINNFEIELEKGNKNLERIKDRNFLFSRRQELEIEFYEQGDLQRRKILKERIEKLDELLKEGVE